MINFFKNFGKGVLYVLVLPFLLVGMAIYGVVALFIWIYLGIKGLILFFTGRSLYEDLPEDKEAKKRLAGLVTNEQQTVTNEDISSAINSNQNEQEINTSTDPFYVPEYLKPEEEETPIEEPVQETIQEGQDDSFFSEPEPVVEETVQETPHEEEVVLKPTYINEEPDTLNVEEDEIILEKTEQKSNILEIKDVEDDDEESSGVNIDFD